MKNTALQELYDSVVEDLIRKKKYIPPEMKMSGKKEPESLPIIADYMEEQGDPDSDWVREFHADYLNVLKS